LLGATKKGTLYLRQAVVCRWNWTEFLLMGKPSQRLFPARRAKSRGRSIWDIAALLLTAVGVVGVCLLLSVVFFPPFDGGMGCPPAVHCRSNLGYISLGLDLYRQHYRSRFPPSLKELYATGVLPDEDVYVCPKSGTTPKKGTFRCDYEVAWTRAEHFVTPWRDERSMESSLVLVWDREPFHTRDGLPHRCVLFLDGHVEFLQEEKFQERLQQLDDWLKKAASRVGRP
jgi:hypothetical protein